MPSGAKSGLLTDAHAGLLEYAGTVKHLVSAAILPQKIGDMHGQTLKAQASYGSVAVVPLYHPAVALYNTGQRDTLMSDFEALKAFI